MEVAAVRGLMQHDELLVSRLLERAETFHPRVRVVTAGPAGAHEESYAELAGRARRVASALIARGIRPGDRVATFAWNSSRHLELYFAVPGMGAVLHTLNARLHPRQVAAIVRHAGDATVFVDPALAGEWGAVAAQLDAPVPLVSLGGDEETSAAVPGGTPYEDLVASGDAGFAWPDVDENDAALLCYTSGTTGAPKGVLSSHRSIYLHALMHTMADTVALSERDVVLSVVPMFHAGGWGFPYSATLVGAAQVLPGALGADAATLAALIETQGVTVATGVPTVWINLLRELERAPRDVSSLRMIKTGGAAMPAARIREYRERHGVEVLQGWGMTETGPLASLARPAPEHDDLSEDERDRLLAGQGRPVPGIRIRVVDVSGAQVPWDAATIGEIQVRGNWVAAGYFSDPARSAEALQDGWLRTGDMATIDPLGFLRLVDRNKDLVKSGGEWISSLELEAALMAHPGVQEAAVVAAPHETWLERPLAFVVRRGGSAATKEELLSSIAPEFPSWWLPDDVVFVDEIPKTSVGKFDKRALRERLGPSSDGGDGTA
jgi:fatty-acyl-CoA synthase